MRNIDLFDDYLFDHLSAADKKQFEDRLQNEPEFRTEFEKHNSFVKTLNGLSSNKQLKTKLNTIHDKEFGKANVVSINTHKSNSYRFLKPAAIAAGIALITVIATVISLSAGGFLITQQNGDLQMLSNKVNMLETKQGAIEKGINNAAKKKKKIYAPANTTGTGFALNSKGYFVTCWHVIAGSDSVFIENKNIERAGARVVYANPSLDIAILKIDSSDVLNWKELPYAFKTSESDMAEKAFTLGYPSSDVVYGEGTISSSTANGDTSMYQISIPVNAGNSGSPLFDERGNLIGIVNSKKANAEGTGYATKSVSINEMLKNIDDAELKKQLTPSKKNSISGMKRSEQVKRMNPYVFNIYVYKAK